MFWATKMEHANRFGIQKTENLEGKKKYTLSMLQDMLRNNMKRQLLYVIRKVGNNDNGNQDLIKRSSLKAVPHSVCCRVWKSILTQVCLTPGSERVSCVC